MKQNARKERLKERRFVHKTIYLSSIVFVALMILAVCIHALYPAWLARQIRQAIDSGQMDGVPARIETLSQRDPQTAEELSQLYEYQSAQLLLSSGEYDLAYTAFCALESYSNSAEMALECQYIKATNTFIAGQYMEAADIFLSIAGHRDSLSCYDRCLYEQALFFEQSGRAPDAFSLFRQLGNYQDAESHAEKLALAITGLSDVTSAIAQLENLSAEEMANQAELVEARQSIRRGVLAVGGRHTVGLQSDGTVLAVGFNHSGQCNVQNWSHAVMVDAGAQHTVALLDNGTVVATGSNEYGQCNVAGWTNVKEIACGDYATFCLFADGTVAATGYLPYSLDGWRNVAHLAAGSYMLCGLHEAGSAYCSHASGKSDLFVDLISIDCSTGGAVGLTHSGRTIASFSAMPEWSDILEISMGSSMVLGIRSDGTVAVHRYYSSAAPGAEDLENIVAISAGGGHYAAMDRDGRVYAFGSNESGQCNTEEWNLK